MPDIARHRRSIPGLPLGQVDRQTIPITPDHPDHPGQGSAYEMFPVIHLALGAGLILIFITDRTDRADEENSIGVIRAIRGQKREGNGPVHA